jgi:diguanylate cyclase (GGDEF)-like protein
MTSGLRARIYLVLRFSALIAIAIHLGIRLAFPEPAVFPDLFIFNFAVFLAAGNAYNSPLFNDRWAIVGISGAMGIWAIGSTLSTVESFYSVHMWRGFSDIAYAVFYPLMLLGFLRSLSLERKIRAIQFLDVTIIGLGATSVLASLLLKPAMLKLDGSAFSVFLAILYPIGDIVLLVIVAMAIILQKLTIKTILLLLGMACFAVTDLYFIWMSATSSYPFASLVDDGWVLGLIFISEATWHRPSEREISPKVISFATLTSLLASGLLLLLAVVKPSDLPQFVLIPAFGTLALSFIRMSIALREAREIKDERTLARTDELTGLPNRRRFINSLAALNNSPATLLLLDLDGFKQVNDTLGHEYGDELLRKVSARFARQIPNNSLIARLGGDEFGAIIYGDASVGMEIARALHACLAYPADLGTHSVTVGVSIGAVLNDGKPELMRRADEAMYSAKKSGNGITLIEV